MHVSPPKVVRSARRKPLELSCRSVAGIHIRRLSKYFSAGVGPNRNALVSSNGAHIFNRWKEWVKSTAYIERSYVGDIAQACVKFHTLCVANHSATGLWKLPASEGLPGYKPVSVPLRAAVIPLGPALLPGSSDLPESRAERAAPPLLFGLAPRGVFPARPGLLQPRCALTAPFHPYLQERPWRRYIFCGTFRETRFERAPPAVSRHAALWRPDFPPATRVLTRAASDCPPGRPRLHYPPFRVAEL